MLFIYSWLVLFLKQLEVSFALYFLAAGWFYRASQKAHTAFPCLPGERIFSLKTHFPEGYVFAHAVKTSVNRNGTEFQAIPHKLYFGL